MENSETARRGYELVEGMKTPEGRAVIEGLAEAARQREQHDSLPAASVDVLAPNDVETRGLRIVPTAEAVADVSEQRDREANAGPGRLQRIVSAASRIATAMAHSEIE